MSGGKEGGRRVGRGEEKGGEMARNLKCREGKGGEGGGEEGDGAGWGWIEEKTEDTEEEGDEEEE